MDYLLLAGFVLEKNTVPDWKFTIVYEQTNRLEKGKGGKVYQKYGALCLETQAFPDAVNHPNFPSKIVRPGGTTCSSSSPPKLLLVRAFVAPLISRSSRCVS